MHFQRVLVTGSSGFLASHLAERRLNQGVSVICLDNFGDYYDPQMKRKNIARALQNPNYRLIEGDIGDRDHLSQIFSRTPAQAVVHLAVRPGVRHSIQHGDLYEGVNVQGTLSVLEMAPRSAIIPI